MKSKTLSVVAHFSQYPAGRLRDHGPFSGEAFREDILIPALKENDIVELVLDGAAGYPLHWLDEAFGQLCIKHNFTQEELRNKLKIYPSKEEAYVAEEIWNYINTSDLAVEIVDAVGETFGVDTGTIHEDKFKEAVQKVYEKL